MAKQTKLSTTFKIIQQGTKKTLDTLMLLKFHEKHDRFALNYLKNYTSKKNFKKISRYIKQGKLEVYIDRKGYSFLISGRDLLPILKSELLPVDDLNKHIESRFFREKYTDFSERAWNFIPEYIGPRIVADKRLKKILALSLFSPNTKINFIDTTETSKRLINYTWLIGKTKTKASRDVDKNYDLNVTVKPARLGGFEEVVNLTSKVVHIRKGDMDFLERYIQDAKNLEVMFPKNLKKKFRKTSLLDLATASARMEMRPRVAEKDIDRVKRLNL